MKLSNGFEQGSPEDKATWWTCGHCSHRGPFVGSDPSGARRCVGSCGVDVRPNPDVGTLGAEEVSEAAWKPPRIIRDRRKDQFTVALALVSAMTGGTYAIEIDRERPFGTDDIRGDILGLINMRPASGVVFSGEQLGYAWDLYTDTPAFIREELQRAREPRS